MKKTAAAIAAAAVLAVALPAHAQLHEVDVANYYFEEVGTGARDPITVDQGDQIRFTVRQGAYPPHDVVIDGYGSDYQSGQLLLFERFTTPPLDKPGTFALYCRAHRSRGHETTLIVKARAAGGTAGTTSSPKPKTRRGSGTASAVRPHPSSSATTAAGLSAEPSASSEPLASAGVDVTTDRRRVSPNPRSLAGLLGREVGVGAPWTSAFWMWLLAGVPVGVITAYALRRELRRG